MVITERNIHALWKEILNTLRQILKAVSPPGTAVNNVHRTLLRKDSEKILPLEPSQTHVDATERLRTEILDIGVKYAEISFGDLFDLVCDKLKGKTRQNEIALWNAVGVDVLGEYTEDAEAFKQFEERRLRLKSFLDDLISSGRIRGTTTPTPDERGEYYLIFEEGTVSDAVKDRIVEGILAIWHANPTQSINFQQLFDTIPSDIWDLSYVNDGEQRNEDLKTLLDSLIAEGKVQGTIEVKLNQKLNKENYYLSPVSYG